MFRKKPLRINTYLGYGTPTRLRAIGRALEDENIDFSGNTNLPKTLWNIFKQFESDEIPNTGIRLTIPENIQYNTKTDAEGYYHFDEALYVSESKDESWIPYTVSYSEQHSKKILKQNHFQGQMLIPAPNASFGIISDIDDTILDTGVASLLKWKLVFNTFFKNFDRRLPLEGMVRFYHKLIKGRNQKVKNPIFYVSNSPWNLYDYLSAFLLKNGFPKGPVLLRDFRTIFDKTPKPKRQHKFIEIENILELYPNLKFILIGDSGEKDADIYTRIAQSYPNRILAIYLRSVGHKRKENRVLKMIRDIDSLPVLLVKNSIEAELHARKMQFID